MWQSGIFKCKSGNEWDEELEQWVEGSEHIHYSNVAYDLCNSPPTGDYAKKRDKGQR